ncbi:Uncharacterized 2Fe-2 and 4Fe-4S clusters-containing protein, contains DUF4445 domain [Caldanaerobius fijiensis DSM 17918]|uniref:Uncharacterized 2Fe-2 and 4Fe-4S clusters-containing protein, contains DUF4445 domain n=1 Tax=Caldanaerobius fijiensis DSM 17918 TaxID=1121256 RepID=A0A1M4ZDL5_9THEO|nr:ASKHA domain-containing protein [Caldanaerobius fijiensis]SHF15676.1 Uncharacterized 2Fe-2 and 4Fe-4S clusters-containing protein, contains DUF4445 domain [Caldanaerobius fijiensis DSM 17918]
MPIEKNIEVLINKSIVLKNMGYKEISSIPQDILKEVDEAISHSMSLIKPMVVYERLPFEVNEREKVVLVDGKYQFKGDYLIRNIKGADSLIIAITTIGPDIDELCDKHFSLGDYFKGMVYDAIGAAALGSLNRKFWLQLVNTAKNEGIGITHRLSPGHNDWDIKDQEVIFSILDGSSIGVELSENFMMKPIKSLSVVYGMGKGIPVSRVDHDCIDCELDNCAFRVMPRAKQSYNVNIINGGNRLMVEVKRNQRLWDVLAEHKVPVENSCNGHGTCGKCRVIVHPVKPFDRLTQIEKGFISKEEAQKGYRLACAVLIDEDMEVLVPEIDRDAVVLSSGKEKGIVLKPRVKKINVSLEEPGLDDQRDDLKRLEDNIGSVKVGHNVIYKLPDVLRQNAFNVNAVVRNGELLDLVSRDREDLYGIAVDIGTTTIAAYFLDLKTGRQLDVYSALNPQKRYGADVITRINHTIMNQRGLGELHDLIIEELNDIVSYFCQNNGINSNDIYEIVVVGNTTMMHMFAGIPCGNIANAPYIPAYTKELEFKASEMEIKINPEGYVVMLPMVSGYIGADTIAAIIASGMYESEEISLLLDIGTNGEIVLGNKDKMISCSAAAGPAFEGAKITFGTGGIAGAISYVDLDSDSIYKTIGDKRPIGICGSGIVDAVSELIRKGIIDETGKMHRAEELKGLLEPRLLKRLVEYNGQVAFVLDDSTGIVLTQKDIRELQLAKGAIAAGVNILIKELGIQAEDIQKVYFAGGFGNYIRIESAVNIGLIPKILKDRIVQIGNGAGVGAKMALLSDDYLELAAKIRNEVKYVELSAMPVFQMEFMNEMYF